MFNRSAVTDEEWTVDGVAGTIEGLSYEFHIEGCTSKAMHQKNPNRPPLEKEVLITVFGFF
jgi:hypothetical protein